MADPNFQNLSEAEQRLVAERLLKIQESGWRPFWCPDPECSGMPHYLMTPDGLDIVFAAPGATAGPNGEPLGEAIWEDADGWYAADAPNDINHPLVGVPVLEPAWAHNHARQDQRLPSWTRPWVLAFLSGRGCIAPWTLIDLADGTRERVDVLARRGQPVQVQTPAGPRWTDGAPFLKGLDHLWRVRLSTGRVLTVTSEHRFLAPGGWLRLADVREGQPLVAALFDPPETADPQSRDGQSALLEDALRCWGTELGSACGCPTCRRPSDQPLPARSAVSPGDAPSPDGEGGHTRSECGSDDQTLLPGCSHACPPQDPRSRKRSSLVGLSMRVGGYLQQPSLPERLPRTLRLSRRSLWWIGPLRGAAQVLQGRGGFSWLPPSVRTLLSWFGAGRPPSGANGRLSRPRPLVLLPDPLRGTQPGSERSDQRSDGTCPTCFSGCTPGTHSASSGLSRYSLQDPGLFDDAALQPATDQLPFETVLVESVEYSHFGPFYDLTVPDVECYHSEGVVNHNSGKTTTGVEFATLSARKGLDGAIIGRRGTELINTHVRTILDRAHPEFVPEFQASKDLLVWPNGVITYLFSAERPENIRSVNLSWYWIDEAAHMDTITTVWMNVRLATRIEKPGNPIHGLITSTPVGSQWMMDLEDNPEIEIRRVSTYANKANLSEDFIRDLERDYEGTRMGRQELHGEVLRDVEGALWNDSMFTHLRVNEQEYQDLLDSMDDRVLAVDPSGSKGPRSDAHGIIGVGAQHTDDNGDRLVSSLFFVLGDATIKGSPAEMARQVFKAARLMRVNRIVVEKNFGGDHVKSTLSDWAKLHPEEGRDENGEEYKIELVHAVRSKETRAEPTVAKYEQARVKHVTSPTAFGDLSDLEKEQVNWVPKSRGGRQPSPNRVDALVWAVRAADTNVRFQATQASPQVLKKLKRGARV